MRPPKTICLLGLSAVLKNQSAVSRRTLRKRAVPTRGKSVDFVHVPFRRALGPRPGYPPGTRSKKCRVIGNTKQNSERSESSNAGVTGEFRDIKPSFEIFLSATERLRGKSGKHAPLRVDDLSPALSEGSEAHRAAKSFCRNRAATAFEMKTRWRKATE